MTDACGERRLEAPVIPGPILGDTAVGHLGREARAGAGTPEAQPHGATWGRQSRSLRVQGVQWLLKRGVGV